MQAIATLVQDDPYLKMTPGDRISARSERKAKFRAPLSEVVHSIVDVTPMPPLPNELMAAAIQFEFKPAFGSVETIQRAVLAFYPDGTLNDMKSDRRTKAVVYPRQIAMYLAKELTTRSLPDIGRRFGGKDHTTVLHAVRKIAALVKTDRETAGHIDEIKALIKSAAHE